MGEVMGGRGGGGKGGKTMELNEKLNKKHKEKGQECWIYDRCAISLLRVEVKWLWTHQVEIKYFCIIFPINVNPASQMKQAT